jgi:hypothetical protein
MAKIKLGDRPKSFKRTVKFPMVEGVEGSIEVSFRYRTRKEFGEFIDSLAAASKLKRLVGDDDKPFSMTELMEEAAGTNAEYLLAVIDGWNLDEELTAANVQQLSDELPGAAAAIMEAYRAAIVEGRLGN